MNKPLKPHLACDYDEAKQKFPCAAMVKIDGVRGINLNGTLTGRSLKTHGNPFVTERFSKPEFLGMDGELAVGDWTSPSLCRDTSGAVSRGYNEPDAVWYVFDYLHPDFIDLPYIGRISALYEVVKSLNLPYLKAVPMTVVNNPEELAAFEEWALEQGFEGVVLRAMDAPHKSGRASTVKGAYLRIKRFIEEEAEVLSLEEAMENQNEKVTNLLGRSERSSHMENLVGKGMVGNMTCRMLKDVYDGTKLLFTAGQIVIVGPGAMTHEERADYWLNQTKLIGQVVKFKFFPKGVKDKPRFPTFVTIRPASDMS
jgi:DNA ligase-1